MRTSSWIILGLIFAMVVVLMLMANRLKDLHERNVATAATATSTAPATK